MSRGMMQQRHDTDRCSMNLWVNLAVAPIHDRQATRSKVREFGRDAVLNGVDFKRSPRDLWKKPSAQRWENGTINGSVRWDD